MMFLQRSQRHMLMSRQSSCFSLNRLSGANSGLINGCSPLSSFNQQSMQLYQSKSLTSQPKRHIYYFLYKLLQQRSQTTAMPYKHHDYADELKKELDES